MSSLFLIANFLCFRPFSVPGIFFGQILMFPLFLLHVIILFALPSLTFLYIDCILGLYLDHWVTFFLFFYFSQPKSFFFL